QETASPPPQRLAAAPPPELLDPRTVAQRLAAAGRSLRCADLKANLADPSAPAIAGFVTSGEARTRLAQLIGDMPKLEPAVARVTIRPWPQCDQMLKAVDDAGMLDSAGAPRLDFNNPSREYHLGDKLILHVQSGAAADGYLYIDFVD